MPDMTLLPQVATAESLICDLERLRDAFCINCGTHVGSQQALMSIAMGFRNAPPCLLCLTFLLKVEPRSFRESLLEYIRSRECYLDAWNWACREAGHPEEVSASIPGSNPHLNMSDLKDHVTDSWDAGDMGCGDLVLELRLRLNSL